MLRRCGGRRWGGGSLRPWGPGRGLGERFPGRPTQRDEAQTEGPTLRPGSQRWERRFWQEEQQGPGTGRYRGTTVVPSGPRAEGKRGNGWRRRRTHPQGFERRGHPALSLLGRGFPHPHPRHPRLRGRGPGKGWTTAAALSSRPPGGSRAGRARGGAAAPTSKPGAPSQIRLRKGRASRGGRQVSADSPFIPRLGGRRPPGGPARPCRASPRMAREQRRRAGRGGATSGRSLPFSGPRAPLPTPVPRKPRRGAFLGGTLGDTGDVWTDEIGQGAGARGGAPAPHCPSVRGREVSEPPRPAPAAFPPYPPTVPRSLKESTLPVPPPRLRLNTPLLVKSTF